MIFQALNFFMPLYEKGGDIMEEKIRILEETYNSLISEMKTASKEKNLWARNHEYAVKEANTSFDDMIDWLKDIAEEIKNGRNKYEEEP